MNTNTKTSTANSWHTIVSKYNKPRISRSVWQLINSVGFYFLVWIAIVLVMKVSPWLTIPLILLAAGLLVRIFIIFHDCGHGSFFRSKKLNRIVGSACGILAFTPFYKWTDSHLYHHQTVGNLDKRGDGDVWTMTVEEYQNSKAGKQFLYRLFRHPVFLIGIAGPLNFMVYSRFTRKTMTKKQKHNIYLTNVILAILITGMSLLIGWKTFLIIQIPVMALAAMGGIYLFYFQHQFDDVIWRRNKEWNYKDMALDGSSFFKLPVVLQWFTGNIGFHHVHHLGPTIPNYNLSKCHKENQIFNQIKPFTIIHSLRALNLRLWDEKNQRIITFREMKKSAI